MSNALRNIKKNAEDFALKDFYNKMTPEQYKKGIQVAINRTRAELAAEFQKKYDKLVDEFNNNLKDGMATAIDTISVELLYELAMQMDAFKVEDEDVKNQIIDKVQEIYENTMNAIKRYATYKNDKQACKEFKKEKKRLKN